MASLETSEPTGATPVLRRHEGSASMSLSSKALLTAWLASILAHLAALVCMFFLVFPFTLQESGAEPAAPRVQLLGPLDGAGFVPSELPDLLNQTPVIDATRIRFKPRALEPPTALVPRREDELSIIGIGVGSGNLADFGLRVGGEKGPEFFGVGGSARGARKVVYVVDRSGSMIDTFDFVRRELKRSILSLRRSQKFHVIFFNAREPLENPPKRLVNAIDAHVEPFFDFLDRVVPTGGTKPEAAMRLALALKPDLVYLLSDGVDFRQGLLDKLDEWNRRRRVRIYTIAYLDQTGRAILEGIAREHGGEFKFVSEYDLP